MRQPRISIHALLAESDIHQEQRTEFYEHFYPRSPCGERPSSVSESASGSTISIHALLAESDKRKAKANEDRYKFLSTLSLRRATVYLIVFPIRGALFLSTLSLRRATFQPLTDSSFPPIISIHALLAESDDYFSAVMRQNPDFYPRSPCGERHAQRFAALHNILISIHALLAESDAVQIVIVVVHALFLSTLSLRRATICRIKISIDNADFYPRSPCGERHKKVA